MGEFFTFEVSIQAKHELITTGPYAYVRHPSYTGVYLTLLGASTVICAPGAALMECGILKKGGVLALFLWVAICMMAFRGMTARLKAEDGILKEVFGPSWENYALKVPKKLLPGIV